jgi:hypothetical protein
MMKLFFTLKLILSQKRNNKDSMSLGDIQSDSEIKLIQMQGGGERDGLRETAKEWGRHREESPECVRVHLETCSSSHNSTNTSDKALYQA